MLVRSCFRFKIRCFQIKMYRCRRLAQCTISPLKEIRRHLILGRGHLKLNGIENTFRHCPYFSSLNSSAQNINYVPKISFLIYASGT